MSTYIGNAAEDAAADYLLKQGYMVIERNWRTPRCEIDVVARKGRIISFVEVKYRRQATQGSGLDYITASKLKQMRYAAEVWIADHNWPGDFVLSALEVSGTDYEVTEFLPEIA